MTKKDEAELSLDEIANKVAEKLEGGKTNTAEKNEEFVRKKDFDHQRELDRLSADAERKASEYQQAIETMNNQLKEALDPNHRSHCIGPGCQVNRVHSQIFQEGFEKGKADAKANLAVDDISPKLVGEWIRVMRKRGGK